MMLTDPSSVRWAERVRTRQAVINGFSIANLGRSLELARELLDTRAEWTVEVVRERLRASR
jgi:hypothetical protein